MSVNSEMTALADAIRDKSGVAGKLSISGMTVAVNSITVGEGGEDIDLSFVTASAGDILSGKVGADNEGNPVYGTLEVDSGSDIDLSGVTVTADKMLSGIVAVGADGNKVTGNIQTVTPTVNKNTFSVGKGYVETAFTETIAEATVTETASSVTITPGYVGDTLVYEIGGNGEDVQYGYITDDGKVQYVDLSAETITPVGEPVEADVYMFEYENRTPLTFTAEEANSAVKLEKSGNENYSSSSDVDLSGIHYRFGTSGAWTPYNEGEDIVLSNIGDKVQFMNTKNKLSAVAGNDSTTQVFWTEVFVGRFAMSGKIRADGNVQSMVNYANCTPYCFHGLFSGCTSLTQAPELPSNQMADRCYARMFDGCTSLTHAPELPAETLSYGCYQAMFRYCTSLTQAPELPAKTLSVHCYSAMFSGCTSLTQAPELPAKTLAKYCYSAMFRDCTSLTQAPELPATQLSHGCYFDMFERCANMHSITVHFHGWVDGDDNDIYTVRWLIGVSESGTFYKPAELPTELGDHRIPSGWNVQIV